MDHFKITLTDKPHLSAALQKNPALVKEVIGTFVALAEESFDPAKGITWAELPQKLHKNLTFQALVRGILRGALDLKDMNPEAYDTLLEELHPLSILSPRKNYLDDTMRTVDWRRHFQMSEDTIVGEAVVTLIIRKLLRYAKYVDIETLSDALQSNQLATFRGLGDRNIALLPMIPALRYQRNYFGELHVGTFYDNIGFLSCGTIDPTLDVCPACQHEGLQTAGEYKVCLNCNAGYTL